MAKTDAGYTKNDLTKNIGKIGSILLGVGIVLGILSYITDPARAAFSYLASYMFLVSLGIGSLFLVALEYAAGAVWSVPFRRVGEFYAGIIPWLILLIVPLLFSLHDLFLWTRTGPDNIIAGKSPYLNIPFLLTRAGVIFIIWSFFYYMIIKNSNEQDVSGDQSLTTKNIKLSIIFMPVFAITISLLGIDWLMSLEPHWFSTIFGVYYFAGTVWCAMALVTLTSVLLYEKGLLSEKLNKDHFYSLGTWLFAFTAFWGYIAFSQYMLIWYGDLPEETTWFFHRWDGAWIYISIVLIIAHFLVPFFSLLSYDAKTNLKRLKFISIWVLAAQFLDVYWMVMPSMKVSSGGYFFSWSDLVFPVAIVGLAMLVFNTMAKKHNITPIRDPKLERGLSFHL